VSQKQILMLANCDMEITYYCYNIMFLTYKIV
jgi:hypothetical protein